MVRGEVGAGFVSAGKEAAAEGRVGYDADVEGSGCAEERDGMGAGVFDFGCEGAVFDLDGGDWVDGLSAPECCGGDFGEAEVADFSLSGICYF